MLCDGARPIRFVARTASRPISICPLGRLHCLVNVISLRLSAAFHLCVRSCRAAWLLQLVLLLPHWCTPSNPSILCPSALFRRPRRIILYVYIYAYKYHLYLWCMLGCCECGTFIFCWMTRQPDPCTLYVCTARAVRCGCVVTSVRDSLPPPPLPPSEQLNRDAYAVVQNNWHILRRSNALEPTN